MMRFLARRLLQMVATLAGLSFLLFGLLSAMPGDPVDLLITSNPSVKPEDVVRLKKLRGLDQPWMVRYFRWLWGHHAPLPSPRVSAQDAVVVVLGADGHARGSVDFSAALKSAGFNPRWKVRPLFGARWNSSEHRLSGVVTHAGLTRFWAQVFNEYGLMTVIVADVWATPPLAPRALDPEALDARALEPHALGPRALGLDKVDDDVRTEQALFAAARAAPRLVQVRPLKMRVVDKPETFSVDLGALLSRGQSEQTIRLDLPALGTIDEDGHYRVAGEAEGQGLVTFTVEPSGRRGAFVVEHGPQPDPSRFERGFLFAFIGDEKALGFSNTYKRPVWEILFGMPVICGDGYEGAGESCDDGNVVAGDGCSDTCYDESLSWLGRVDAWSAGVLLGSGRVLNTLSLMLPALLLSFLIAIPIGVLAAVRQYGPVDYIVNFLAFVGISMPVFWVGIMMMAVFAERLHWLPAGGIQTPGIDGSFFEVLFDRLRYTLMPATVLSIAYTGRWLRYMRASMLEVLPLDFVRTARAKGLHESVVVLKHALRNALIPVVTVLALSLPSLFGGAVLTEWVFSWPGIGRLQFDAVMGNDSYVAIVVFLVSAALVMTGNLCADVLYVLIDPRLRRAGR